MRSLPRKEALDEKKRETFILINMLRILDSCKAWPTSRPRTEGENTASKAYEPNSWSYTWREKQ
jgi:hypothetical protein